MYEDVDAEYAASRLNGTIVRYDGEPVIINHIYNSGGGNTADFELLGRRKTGTARLKNIDCTPVPLGFANCAQGVSFLARLPKRSDYRQGLRRSNYTALYGVDHRNVDPTALVKTIKGHYPEFEFCLDESFNSGSELSFCRQFSVKPAARSKKKSLLQFKWLGTVGDIVNGEPILMDQYNYLQEALEEALNGKSS